MQRIKAFRALARLYGKDLEIIQGESGSQSKSGGSGAFGWIRTNQDMQTKYLLRHTVAELISGVKFTSVFSSVDMAENLDAKDDGPITTCGYFGLLGAEFDPSSGKLMGEYYEKPSYYAFRNICSIFDENVSVADVPVLFTPQRSKRLNGFDCPTKELIYGSLSKASGAKAFVYWNSTDLITCQGYESSATFEIAGVCGDIRLVDPMDGSIYELPDKMVKDKGNRLFVFENMPVRDYPLILTFWRFFEVRSLL